jgi:hypothetical protein
MPDIFRSVANLQDRPRKDTRDHFDIGIVVDVICSEIMQ